MDYEDEDPTYYYDTEEDERLSKVDVIENVLESLDNIKYELDREIQWLVSECSKSMDTDEAMRYIKPLDDAFNNFIKFLNQEKDEADNY